MNKQVKQIIGMFEPGFSVRPAGSGHYTITYESSGVPVRDNSGLPITIPSSPAVSERMNIIKGLERVGVIVRGKPPTHRAGSDGGGLVRDDLEGWQAYRFQNKLETSKIRKRLLVERNLELFFSRKKYRSYLVTAICYVSGLEEATVSQLVDNLWKGKVLTPGDREPFEQLEAEFKTQPKARPSSYLYSLVREAKGLVPRKEMVVATIESQSSTVDTHQVFDQFTQSLRDKRAELVKKQQEITSEIEGIDGFIKFSSQMEEMMSNLGLSFVSSGDGHTGTGSSGQSGSGVSLSPPSQTDEASSHPRAQEKLEMKNKFLQAMGEGGEWSQRELADHFGVSIQTSNTYIRELVEEGKVVMVEPGSGTGDNPSRYGSAEFYGKN